jgi:cytochrome c-type biogenesis protein
MKINLLIALGAGITSFLSPCILPVLPGYMAYLAGVAAGDKWAQNSFRRALLIFLHSLFFVFGFSIVFIMLGASATLIGFILRKYMFYIIKVAGAIVIILGLQMIELLKIRFLEMGWSMGEPKIKKGFTRSFLAGLLFSFSWTPCISPVLAGILTLASQEETVMKGMLLLSFYSAGLGIPLIIIGTGFGSAIGIFLRKHSRKFQIVSGVILIFIGILLLTGKYNLLF